MKTPFGYQHDDALRLATDDSAHGLAGKPGTGKTFTALLACSYLTPTPPPVLLIICPAVALDVWDVEVADTGLWAPVLLRDALRLKRYRWPGKSEPVAYIVSYEHIVASSNVRDFIAGIFDLGPVTMICDEGHYLKNPQAKRTQLVYGSMALRASRTWALSGTFMLNHPGELWPHLSTLAPARIDRENYWIFTRRYCRIEKKEVRVPKMIGKRKVMVTIEIEVISGANREALPELRKRVKGLFIPRAPDENLPPLRFASRPIHRSQCDTALLREFESDPEIAEEVRKLERALASDDPIEALKGVNSARVRRMMALIKAPAVVRWVQDILENSKEKVLVWGWHTAALDHYMAGLQDWNPVMIRGDTPHARRGGAVKRFNTDADCRVFVGQIQAAGTAITLNAGSREVFGEEAYTPALNYQAAKRCHRIGQDKAVLVDSIYLRGSVDERVAAILHRKQTDIAALDGAI